MVVGSLHDLEEFLKENAAGKPASFPTVKSERFVRVSGQIVGNVKGHRWIEQAIRVHKVCLNQSTP